MNLEANRLESRSADFILGTEGVHQADCMHCRLGTRCHSWSRQCMQSAQEQRPRVRLSEKPLTLAERQSVTVSARPASQTVRSFSPPAAYAARLAKLHHQLRKLLRNR